MAQYIDKAALVAEIERRATFFMEESKKKTTSDDSSYAVALYGLLLFIDTLEVKEVDFDALGILAEHLIACEAHGVTPKYRDREIDLLEKLKNNKAQKEN